MSLISTAPTPIKLYKLLRKHGVRLSIHAFRVITVSAVTATLSFIIINASLWTIQITSLPLFLRVGNINLGLQTPGDAEVLLNSYGQAKNLKLVVQGQAFSAPAKQAGIKLNVGGIMNSIQHPSGWNKVPLIYALNNRHRSFPLQYTVNNKTLNSYVGSLKLPRVKVATDASIVIPANARQAAYIAPEKIGYEYPIEKLAAQIAKEVITKKNLAITAQAQMLQPKISASQLTPALDQVNVLLGRALTITNGDQSYKLTPADLRRIVSLSTAASGLPVPQIDQKQIVELLRAHSNLFYKAPTPSRVSTLDSNVISESEGTSGQAVNIEASAAQIAKALQAGQTQQTLAMSTVNPDTTYLRDYTATSAGLAALIRDFAATHPGTYAVATIELNDNRSAFYNQTVGTVPASTYKLFVAYVALKQIEQGSLSFSSPTSAGSLDACLQKMILVSDNTCAMAILDLLGWSQAEGQIKAAGFSSTNINNSGGGYMTSTASDIANLLKGFYDGSLLSTSSTDYLFGLMKQQVYRSGIPAGSFGAVVADKVGFLYTWNHDAAIVYAPNSTYILVILTTNSGFAQIKDLAGQIYNLYNQ